MILLFTKTPGSAAAGVKGCKNEGRSVMYHTAWLSALLGFLNAVFLLKTSL